MERSAATDRDGRLGEPAGRRPSAPAPEGPLLPPAEPLLPTLHRWLTIVAPHLASTLVDETALRRLDRAARSLPADGLGIIEVRLGGGEPQVDLSVRLTRPEQARWMAGQVARPHLQAFLSRW